MSDTPRTDVAEHNVGSVVEPHYVVDVEVAQGLERELAEAQAEIVRLSNELDSVKNDFDTAIEQRNSASGFYQIVMAAAAKIRKGE